MDVPAAALPRPRRLASAVEDALLEAIITEVVAPGETLPPEPALCETYGVSRTVVREAIKSLEVKGLVKAVQGQGTTVRPMVEWNLTDPQVLATTIRHDDALAILDDIIEVRVALESHMAARGAVNATDEDRREISARMNAMIGLADPDEYAIADIAFHDAIFAASGNRLGRAIIRSINAEANRSQRYIGEVDVMGDEHWRLGTRAHQEIHDAVIAGDGPAAADAMERHIRESWDRRRPQVAAHD